MTLRDICHEIEIKGDPGAIYQALTDAQKLGQWWIPDTRGASEVGAILEFWHGEACQRMKVIALEPGRTVRWHAQGSSDWERTEIEFAIRSGDQGCWVRFRHAGLRSDLERLPYYSTSWAVFLLSLKELLETGKGFPFPNRWISQ